jgi:hypothetical protein
VCQLVAPLRRQEQWLEERSEGPADPIAAAPEQSDFLIAQCSIALDQGGRHLEAVRRSPVDD